MNHLPLIVCLLILTPYYLQERIFLVVNDITSLPLLFLILSNAD